GVVDAMIHLGDAFRDGKGLPMDAQRAVRYYGMALNSGDAASAVRLGNMFLTGGGNLVGNPTRAVAYFEQALALHRREAFVILGDIYRDGSAVTSDLPRAISYYERGLRAGDTSAAMRLAEVYV